MRHRFALGLGVILPASIVFAQPTFFFQVEQIEVPASPPEAQQLYTSFRSAFDPSGETLTVKWFRFELASTLTSQTYLDIDTRIDSSQDVLLALYDNAGNLVAVDDVDGSFPTDVAAGLSFGSNAVRTPPILIRARGQDGLLTAGTYWLALAAGSLNQATVGTTNWSISTTASFQIDRFNPVDLAFVTGNTIPNPPPANDECTGAIVVGESTSPGVPVWLGTNQGATPSPDQQCAPPPTPELASRDVWFSYVPTRTGRVLIEATGGAGGAATPVLTAYSSCQGSILACSAGGALVVSDATRIFVDVQQGQPVPLSIGIDAGQIGPLGLNISYLPDPCPLNVSPDAVVEIEACGDNINTSCVAGDLQSFVPGQSLTGTFTSSSQNRDIDWFSFTLTERQNVTVGVRSQLPAVVYVFTDACFQAPAPLLFTNGDYFDNTCNEAVRSVTLDPGTYRLGIAPLNFDDFACSRGYTGWTMNTQAGACVAPTVTASPTNAVICAGGSATFTGGAQSDGPITYTWEIGADDRTGNIDWQQITDDRSFSFSQYLLFGVTADGLDTNQLQLTIDTIFLTRELKIRMGARVCDTVYTAPATLVTAPAGSPECNQPIGCDSIDFNGNEVFPEDQDVIDFFFVLSGGECSTGQCNDIDFNNNDVFPEDQDVIDFFTVLAGGDCP